MKKVLIAVFLSVVLLPQGAFAQNVIPGQSGSGSSGSGVGSVVSLPPETEDADEIVQLNNLVVQSVSGTSFPAIIYASRDVGSVCINYETIDSARGKTVTCPVAPSILYSINVDADTRLLLRNRTRATLTDFAEGDRINAFGFLGSATNQIDALIVRNLDKPVGYRYVQLNNMEIVSGPMFATPALSDADGRPVPERPFPADIVVARKFPNPCLGFATESSSGFVIPCPLLDEAVPSDVRSIFPGKAVTSASVSGQNLEINPIATYPFRRYTVTITEATQLVNRVRQAISIYDLKVGHKVNVYGRLNTSTNKIEGIIVRDLSLPLQGASVLRVQAVDGEIVCITSPCGVITTARIELYRADGRLVGVRTTEKGEAVFENVEAGKYVIKAEARGYEAAKQEVAVEAGGTQSVIVSLSGGSQGKALRVIYPNGGETLLRGSQETIRWTLEAPQDSNLILVPTTFDIFLITYDDRERVFTIATRVPFDPQAKVQSYVWTVPQTLEKILIGDGAYFVRVCETGACYAGALLRDRSDGPFKVTSEGRTRVMLKALEPSRGFPGVTVKIFGEGFVREGNTAYFGETPVEAKLDGSMLVFSVPAHLSPPCYLKRADVSSNAEAAAFATKPVDAICMIAAYPLPAGVYKVWVVNGNGTSNALPFTVMSQFEPPTPLPFVPMTSTDMMNGSFGPKRSDASL